MLRTHNFNNQYNQLLTKRLHNISYYIVLVS